jgi:hypothetical protein
MMRTLRGGRGLGDSIYLQSIAHHFTRKVGERICVATDFPAVFEQMGRRVKTIPFTRQGITVLAHYVARKGIRGTSQFTDMCMQAGILQPIPLHLEWSPTDEQFVKPLAELGKPVVCVQLPRAPMGRVDGFGAELLPDCSAIQAAIDALRGRATLVQIGSGRSLHDFDGIDVDLANRTTVSQLIDIVATSHACIGYPSFIVPLAESLGKPSLVFWSRAGLRSQTAFIAQVTPEKILHKLSSVAIHDDASAKEILHAARALL